MGAIHLVSQDTTVSIDASVAGDSWILKEGVYLAVGTVGFSGGMTAAQNRLVRIDGHVVAGTAGLSLGKSTLEGGWSTVDIGASGSINAGTTGIALLGGSNLVNNNGTIVAESDAVSVGGGYDHVINQGEIMSSSASGVSLNGNYSTLENSGLIAGHFGVLANGSNATISNSGTIQSVDPVQGDAAVRFTAGGTFVNTGIVSNILSYVVVGSMMAESVSNYGIITGGIDLGGGVDVFDNNGGVVNGYIDLGDGDDFYSVAGIGAGASGVFGGEGDDTFVIDSSSAAIHEGFQNGTDWVVSSVSYALRTNFEGLSLSGDEDLRAGGNNLDNILYGNSGDNRLLGRGGDDALDGGEGADIIRGGSGVDSVYYGMSEEGISINLYSGYCSGGSAEGDRLLSVENVGGSGFDDNLRGNASDNVLDGEGGSDILRGYSGADTFVFTIFQAANSANNDIVADFVNGSDKIMIEGGVVTFDSFNEVVAIASQQGANVVLAFGADETLTLQNVTMAQLDASDFIFA